MTLGQDSIDFTDATFLRLIPILVPTLTCFLAVLAGLGFFCYRDYRARKTRMPQGPT